jgi:hypothetical protein
MGGVFEGVCRQAVRLATVALPFAPTRVGEWWDASSTEQIDIVAVGADGELLVAECKWGEVVSTDLSTLERRANLLAQELGGVRRVFFALFSGQGQFDPAVIAARDAGRVLCFAGAALA